MNKEQFKQVKQIFYTNETVVDDLSMVNGMQTKIYI